MGGVLYGSLFSPSRQRRPMPPFTKESPALAFEIHAKSRRARASTIYLPHGLVETPVFMPVGTQGTIKGLTPDQMKLPPLDYQIILANTYHLALRPSTELLDEVGGLHNFMNWDRNILTDSGGFQMVSLLELAEITEEGVLFQSPVDGTRMLLTPEMSIQHQNRIGSDIIMALDDVAPSTIEDDERFTEACHRTLRWIDRCIKAHTRPNEQNLFGIIQGGLDVSDGGLRDICLNAMIKKNLPGYAIGGLAGGEDKSSFWRVVSKCTRVLPEDKPRYLMGVGYPLDLVICSALGVDMFDCVYPTRTGRFGTAMVPQGLLKLRASEFAKDKQSIDKDCLCFVCKKYSRSYLHLLLKHDGIGPLLVTYHNLAYMRRLMKSLRQSILDKKFDQFVRNFMINHFPNKNYPIWAIEALEDAGIFLDKED